MAIFKGLLAVLYKHVALLQWTEEAFRLSAAVCTEMDAYALHMAMAALVGASVVAISAYFMHRKTLEQVLEYARQEREIRRGRSRNAEGFAFGEDDAHSPKAMHDRKSQRPTSRHKAAGSYRGRSPSLPDVTVAKIVDGHENGICAASNVDVQGLDEPKNLTFPPRLPLLQIHPEGREKPYFSFYF